MLSGPRQNPHTFLTQILIIYRFHYGHVPPRHKWNSISLDLIFIYQINIVIPYASLLCTDFSCTVSSHTSDLDMFYHNIIDACVLATNDAIPYRSFSMPQDKHKHLPGWTPELHLAREQSLFWHFI